MRAREFVELWGRKLGLKPEEGWNEDTKTRYSLLLEEVSRSPRLLILDAGAGVRSNSF